MSYLLYQLIGWFLLLAAAPFFFPTYLPASRREELRQRLGLYKEELLPRGGKPRIWLHAASVGEVQAARALIEEIKTLLPEAVVIVSTMTRQGQNVARQQLGDAAHCIFAPLDLGLFTARALKTIQPDLYVCLETELWPAILRQAEVRGTRLALLNGRLSERSERRYRLIGGLIAQTLRRFTAIAAIGPADAERFRALGAAPDGVIVTGNAKDDLAASQPAENPAARFRAELRLPEAAPVWVAGSTHGNEEAQLIGVYRTLKKELPGLVWIVAPRHLQRLAEIEALFKAEGLGFDRRSGIGSRRNHDVILVDTMGELAGLYATADYVFCGGSLVERGGHNLFEAAVWGKPVLYGPSMKDFSEAKALLEEVGAGFPVTAPAEIASQILAWVARPETYRAAAEKARTAVLSRQGAARRQAQLIQRLLAPPRPSAG
ncbi:MAG: 3-deoxy-D-manno-octulosonic acid transferase [Thermodesulfobacteriota bacterium]